MVGTKDRLAAVTLSTVSDRLRFLARCLGFDPPSAADQTFRRVLGSAAVPWRDLLALADRELLTPALWVRLRDRDWARDLPSEVALQLRRRHAVNLIRNGRMRAELERVIGRLNEVEIEPIVLKGGVDLLVPRYPDRGARVTRDVDIFVAKADIDRAIAALGLLGYSPVPREVPFTTYYVDLAAPSCVAPIDLQWYISSQRDVLSPDEAVAASLPVTIGDMRFRTLSPGHQIIHNVLHSELQDRGSDVGMVWLRQLFDLAVLRRRYDDTLDWQEIWDHFTRRGLGAVLRNRLYMADRLLGLPPPAGFEPSIGAKLHYRRCLAQLRWGWAREISRTWATLTSPFDARLLDVTYACGTSPWRIGLVRVQHFGRLLATHARNPREIIQRRKLKFD